MELKNIKNVIFDLDGTLIDSALDIISSFEKACRLAKVALGKKPDKYIVGPPIGEIVKSFIPRISSKSLREVVSGFRSCYDNSGYSRTKLRPGVEKVLRFLAKNGIKTAIVTNKPLQPSRKILKKLRVEKYFLLVVSPDIIPGQKLDKARMIKYVLRRERFAKNFTITVGDAPTDAFAARKNGLPVAVILGGYAKKKQIAACKPDFILSKADDLLKLKIF
jgi:phosphoglycolate phosphatase